jgi:Lamin Tail Domain
MKNALLFCFFIVFGASILRGQVKPYDILITEIMARPSEKQKLPNAEFIEIYNRTNGVIYLDKWEIVNGDNIKSKNKKKLRFKALKPKAYLIICDTKKGKDFSVYGDTMTIDSLFSLGNTKDKIFLKNEIGLVIDAVDYDKLDYQDAKKSLGGYSLERINYNAPCDFNNWKATNNVDGGSPGKENTVIKLGVDSFPQIEHYYYKDKTLKIRFDRSMYRLGLKDTSSFFSRDLLSQIDSLKVDSLFYNEYEITFKSTLKDTNRYRFTIKSNLSNCDTQPKLPKMPITLAKNDTLWIKKSESISETKSEIIINEVLINPESGGSRYLELYNRSNKAIDVSGFSISDDTIKVRDNFSDFVILPDSFLIVADNPVAVQKRYKVSHLNRSFLKYKLPTWNENKGRIYLYSKNDKPLDSLFYTKSFHNPLLASTDGVALERINPNEPTNVKSNWQSAAATVGYGTPAYKNSQFLVEGGPSVFLASDDVFTIPKPTFSPDDDGFEDYLLLEYELDKTGAFAKVSVFDVKGHLVKKWMDNEPLSTKGALKWEGNTDENIKAPIGIYIVYIELILPTGEVQRFKKTISLTTRF